MTVEQKVKEYDLGMRELKRFLNMHEPETLVGGIRNLAQAMQSYKENFQKAQKTIEELQARADTIER